jgi:hypothetical protein
MRLMWLMRLLSVAVLGAIHRAFRRIVGRSPRIWRGPKPLHMSRDLTRADRVAGYPSRSVVERPVLHRYALVSEEDFDVVLQRPGVAPDTLHWRAMIDLHLNGDIWAAHFDCHFFPVSHRRRNELALWLCNAAGIRIVVAPHGSDVVRLDRPVTRFDWIGRMQRDYPTWDFLAQTPVSRTRIELFTRHASFIVAADPATRRLLDRCDLTFKYFAVEMPPVPLPSTNEDRHVVHAPNHRFVKGTDFLMEAISRVRRAGIHCELDLVEGVARPEALRRYAQADIVADQFCIGAFGVFALEGLALGKPVLVYLDEEHLRNPILNLPVLNATPENLAEVLGALLAVPGLSERIGFASRAAMERYQSIEALGAVWDRIYRHVWRGAPLDFSGTAHFSPERQPRSTTEDPIRAEFWPVNVIDLIPRIELAVRAIRQF